MLRRSAFVVAAALVAAGCGGGGSSQGGQSACAALLEFQSREYLGEAARGVRLDLAEPAGTAVQSGCNDVSPGSAIPASTVQAFKLVGIPVERAIALDGLPNVVYVARGVCKDETTPTGLVACLKR